MAFVVDISMAASWALPNEASPATEAVLLRLAQEGGVVPSLFRHEARSVVAMAVRRGWIDPADAAAYLAEIVNLPLADRGAGSDELVLGLARRHNLSTYDATYLALAIEQRLALATLDRRLAEAARSESVTLLGPLA